MATARGGFELLASTESQACFGNAFLELLQAPRTEPRSWRPSAPSGPSATGCSAEEVVSCFSLAPSDDVAHGDGLPAQRLPPHGLLLEHMVVGGERKDAILWSRKLANPSDE